MAIQAVARSTIYKHVLWIDGQQQRPTKEEKGKDKLRRQTETAEEREARSINRLGHFGIYLCDVHSLKLLIDWSDVENTIDVGVLL